MSATLSAAAAAADDRGGSAPAPIQAFTFGDAEPVLDRRDMLGLTRTWHNGRWWEPPVNMNGLTKAFDMPGPHASCIRLKANQLAKYFRPSRWLSSADFRRWALDFLGTGNGYLERRTISRSGRWRWSTAWRALPGAG